MIYLYCFLFSFVISFVSPYLIWKRWYFLADVLAHSALFSVTFSSFFDISPFFVAFPVSFVLIFSSVVHFSTLSSRKTKEYVSIRLLILSSLLLSLGFFFIDLKDILKSNSPPIEIKSLFSGDLLLISHHDIYKLLCCLPFCLFFIKNKIKLQRIAFDEDLAQAEGVNVFSLKLFLSLFLSFFLCVSFESLGVLLTPGLFMVPPLCGSVFAKTPLQMIYLTAIFTFLSMILGVSMSNIFDLTTSPFILLCSVLIFLLSYLLKKIKSARWKWQKIK
jgi:ABC-type Mn2+/Zn2+ transport system permease subunit